MEQPGAPLRFLERQTPCPQCGSVDSWVAPEPQGHTAQVYCAGCLKKLAVLTRPTLKEMPMPVATKDPTELAPPSSPMMTAAPKPEPDDIADPLVPPGTIDATIDEKAPSCPQGPLETSKAVSTLPEGFGAHEALLQGFCQHVTNRLHTWMLDEHRQLTQGMDAMLATVRDYTVSVFQGNEHSTYQLAGALETLQAEGLTVITPPYQAVVQAQSPAGYGVTFTFTKGTSSALVEDLGRLEDWLKAQGYTARAF